MGHDVTTDIGWIAALDDVVTSVVGLRRQMAALEAAQARLLSDAVDLVTARTMQGRSAGRRMSTADLAIREVAAELGTAMRVTDRTIQARMGDAATLVTRFPATFTALCEGRIDAAHVSAIRDAGTVIVDDTLRARFEAAILPIAETEAPGRLRGIAAAIAATIDPDAVADERQRAVEGRRVRRYDLGGGLGRLIVDHDLVLIDAIVDRATEIARQSQHGTGDVSATARDTAAPAASDADADGEPAPPTVVTGPHDAASSNDGATHAAPDADAPDTRTLDQVRADACVALLLAGDTGGLGGDAVSSIRAHVQITVPALTATASGTEPCLLPGRGPIDTALALTLAGNASGWDRVLTDPHTGAVLGTDRYQPTAALRRHLQARDEHCRFPGCTRPAVRSDLDHTKDAAKGGPTTESNLGHFCRRHHTLKHHTAWKVRQRPGGVIEWRAPTGRIHTDRPPATVRFIPSDWLQRARATQATDDPPPPF